MTHHERRHRRKAIADYVNSGKSAAEAATIFKVCVPTVRSACRENDVKIVNGVHNMNLSTFKVIALLLRTDRPLADIAKEFNVSGTRISEIYRKCQLVGIKVKPRAKCKAGN